MTRVNVIVEGRTEVVFVRKVLAEMFWPLGILLSPTVIGTPGHKGGRTNYERVRNDVLNQLKQDERGYCTTMFDFYGLGKGFPRGKGVIPRSGHDRVKQLEDEWKRDICSAIPDLRPELRFIPHLCLHEFEALLFSDPLLLAEVTGNDGAGPDLKKIRDSVPSPEDIDDSPASAPSKRIARLIPGYDKIDDGIRAAEKIGLAKMQEQCPHFRDWINQLKSITPIP